MAEDRKVTEDLVATLTEVPDAQLGSCLKSWLKTNQDANWPAWLNIDVDIFERFLMDFENHVNIQLHCGPGA